MCVWKEPISWYVLNPSNHNRTLTNAAEWILWNMRQAQLGHGS